MNYLDIYYRAFRDYRQNTQGNRECEGQRSATVKANAKADSVIITKKVCHVETDWIEAIERGLEHVDKAIREDRQFIRSNGEVVDIEKVRSVSKDSVKHLAEHSSLITRYEEGQDIVPDRLYIVERLNDYAVYENRFLYMMLCYLRDFITVRYNEILELEHTYNADMSMSKKIDMSKRQLAVDIKLHETKQDDPYLAERSGSKNVIARIRNILELVHAFLSTPLMEEVSKVAMIKPPITKTNVLRMNHNFRGALALYEYVAAYDKPGYIVTEEVQKIQPFRMDMADEFAEIVLLSSFLTYEHGMGIRSDLQANWELEEDKRRREQEQRLVEQIKALRRRIQEEGISPEEYMVLLEKRNRRLESDSEQLAIALQHIEELELSVKNLTEENATLTATVADLHATIDKLHADYQGQITALHADYQAQIAALHEDYKNQISALHTDYQEQITKLRRDYQAQIDELNATYTERIELMKDAHAEECQQLKSEMQEAERKYREELETLENTHRTTVEEMTQAHTQRLAEITSEWQEKSDALGLSYREKDERMAALLAENKALIDARRLSDARLQALRGERGYQGADTSLPASKEEFEELEKQYKLFKAMFTKEWKRTKRQIRKSSLAAYKQAIKDGKEKEFLEALDGDRAAAPEAGKANDATSDKKEESDR